MREDSTKRKKETNPHIFPLHNDGCAELHNSNILCRAAEPVDPYAWLTLGDDVAQRVRVDQPNVSKDYYEPVEQHASRIGEPGPQGTAGAAHTPSTHLRVCPKSNRFSQNLPWIEFRFDRHLLSRCRGAHSRATNANPNYFNLA